VDYPLHVIQRANNLQVILTSDDNRSAYDVLVRIQIGLAKCDAAGPALGVFPERREYHDVQFDPFWL